MEGLDGVEVRSGSAHAEGGEENTFVNLQNGSKLSHESNTEAISSEFLKQYFILLTIYFKTKQDFGGLFVLPKNSETMPVIYSRIGHLTKFVRNDVIFFVFLNDTWNIIVVSAINMLIHVFNFTDLSVKNVYEILVSRTLTIGRDIKDVMRSIAGAGYHAFIHTNCIKFYNMHRLAGDGNLFELNLTFLRTLYVLTKCKSKLLETNNMNILLNEMKKIRLHNLILLNKHNEVTLTFPEIEFDALLEEPVLLALDDPQALRNYEKEYLEYQWRLWLRRNNIRSQDVYELHNIQNTTSDIVCIKVDITKDALFPPRLKYKLDFTSFLSQSSPSLQFDFANIVSFFLFFKNLDTSLVTHLERAFEYKLDSQDFIIRMNDREDPEESAWLELIPNLSKPFDISIFSNNLKILDHCFKTLRGRFNVERINWLGLEKFYTLLCSKFSDPNVSQSYSSRIHINGLNPLLNLINTPYARTFKEINGQLVLVVDNGNHMSIKNGHLDESAEDQDEFLISGNTLADFFSESTMNLLKVKEFNEENNGTLFNRNTVEACTLEKLQHDDFNSVSNGMTGVDHNITSSTSHANKDLKKSHDKSLNNNLDKSIINNPNRKSINNTDEDTVSIQEKIPDATAATSQQMKPSNTPKRPVEHPAVHTSSLLQQTNSVNLSEVVAADMQLRVPWFEQYLKVMSRSAKDPRSLLYYTTKSILYRKSNYITALYLTLKVIGVALYNMIKDNSPGVAPSQEIKSQLQVLFNTFVKYKRFYKLIVKLSRLFSAPSKYDVDSPELDQKYMFEVTKKLLADDIFTELSNNDYEVMRIPGCRDVAKFFQTSYIIDSEKQVNNKDRVANIVPLSPYGLFESAKKIEPLLCVVNDGIEPPVYVKPELAIGDIKSIRQAQSQTNSTPESTPPHTKVLPLNENNQKAQLKFSSGPQAIRLKPTPTPPQEQTRSLFSNNQKSKIVLSNKTPSKKHQNLNVSNLSNNPDIFSKKQPHGINSLNSDHSKNPTGALINSPLIIDADVLSQYPKHVPKLPNQSSTQAGYFTSTLFPKVLNNLSHAQTSNGYRNQPTQPTKSYNYSHYQAYGNIHNQAYNTNNHQYSRNNSADIVGKSRGSPGVFSPVNYTASVSPVYGNTPVIASPSVGATSVVNNPSISASPVPASLANPFTVSGDTQYKMFPHVSAQNNTPVTGQHAQGHFSQCSNANPQFTTAFYNGSTGTFSTTYKTIDSPQKPTISRELEADHLISDTLSQSSTLTMELSALEERKRTFISAYKCRLMEYRVEKQKELNKLKLERAKYDITKSRLLKELERLKSISSVIEKQ